MSGSVLIDPEDVARPPHPSGLSTWPEWSIKLKPRVCNPVDHKQRYSLTVLYNNRRDKQVNNQKAADSSLAIYYGTLFCQLKNEWSRGACRARARLSHDDMM